MALVRRLAVGRFGHTFSTRIAASELSETSGPSGQLASAAAAVAGGSGGLTARYQALVAAGTLRHDRHQESCVLRLERLQQELSQHSARVAEHQHEVAQHQQRRAALERELVRAEEARLLAEELSAEEGAASHLSNMRSWLSTALGQPPAQQQARRSAAQRRAVARSRVQARLDERLGPPPAPPPGPKGVYLHGSVGSGKSLLMDLLSASVHQEGTVQHHRRLHFNAAMLELHSRMHAIERKRVEDEGETMAQYSAAVQQQREQESAARRQEQGPAAAAQAAQSGGHEGTDKGGDGGWQRVLRMDPVAQKLQRSKLARMAFRRVLRDKMNRSAAEQSSALAAGNASILRHAARALIRNCDTLELMSGSSGGSSSSGSGTSSGGRTSSQEAAGSEDGVPSGGSAQAVAPAGGAGGGGSTQHIAALLCFDEMQISDTFSAVAVKALFEALVAEGCVVVTTSNRAPSELDSHGLNELMFDHLIHTLHSACDVVPLNSEEDYRRLLAASAAPLQPLQEPPGEGLESVRSSTGGSASSTCGGGAACATSAGATSAWQPHPQASYFFPLGPAAEAALEAQWRQLAGDTAGGAAGASSPPSAALSSNPSHPAPAEIPVMFGRRLRVERAAGGVAWFQFEELCARPLGPADYLAISQAFHTVFLEGVPAMSMQIRDQARRFITLVDELYNHRSRLVCSAATAPDQLFAGADHEEPIIDLESLQFESAVEGSRLRRNLMADGGVAPVATTAAQATAAAQRLGGVEERFAFARAVSRLYEMQSPLYLASRPRS